MNFLCPSPNNNTFRVFKQTPRVDTYCVQSIDMKTIGERIKQAREALGWSGEYLAKAVGYKTQSGISNLESRATGSGGNKIGVIAQKLNVPVDWLVNGPDTDNVPFMAPNDQPWTNAKYTTTAESSSVVSFIANKENDEWTLAAIAIMNSLNRDQRAAMVAKMREYSQFLGPPRDGQALSVAG